VIGIYGVGGIGKTTFCKILCNGMAAKYEGKICYLEFHSTINSSLVELLQKVLIELTSFSHENLQQLDEGQVITSRLMH
jgi:ABC-type multidrug transport system ATPase subunit